MPKSDWQKRVERARHLAAEYTTAADILRFYATVAEFQGELCHAAETGPLPPLTNPPDTRVFNEPRPESMDADFGRFLSVVAECGPPALAQAALDRQHQEEGSHSAFLIAYWQGTAGVVPLGADDFLARAFLQPLAVHVRSQQRLQPRGPTPCLCPYCGRKPGLGVLRPQGDGGLRSLICSFCLYEWEFRRILCPACGEGNHAKLPVYTADQFPHVRVESCDTCRCYIKTVDLTRNGLADPVVDEIASILLDLWAREQGYAKLQLNLMQL